MKKHRFNLGSMLLGLVVGMIITTATPALAAAVAEQISVYLGRMDVYVNGRYVTNDTILYNDRTYVQLRPVIEAMGDTLSWNPNDPTRADIVTTTQSQDKVTDITASYNNRMTVNSSQTMVVTVYPTTATNKNVSFASSNSNVFTIDSTGYIRAKRTGTADVIVKSADGNCERRFTLTITSSSSTVKVNQIELDLLTRMKIGESQRVSVTCYPSNADDRNVRFNSGNSNVFTVDDQGYIKAVGTGSAYLYVDSVDGNVSVKKEIEVTNDDGSSRSFFGRSAKYISPGVYKIDWNGKMIEGTVPNGWVVDIDVNEAAGENPNWLSGLTAGHKFKCGSMTIREAK